MHAEFNHKFSTLCQKLKLPRNQVCIPDIQFQIIVQHLLRWNACFFFLDTVRADGVKMSLKCCTLTNCCKFLSPFFYSVNLSSFLLPYTKLSSQNLERFISKDCPEITFNHRQTFNCFNLNMHLLLRLLDEDVKGY